MGGCSSAGRATALHAVGRRFDPVHLQMVFCSFAGEDIYPHIRKITKNFDLSKQIKLEFQQV